MKRLSASNLISISPSSDEQNPGSSHVCGREFQSMLDGIDEEACLEDSGHILEKKRRLSVDQVKALEKNFETENKLEPERKVKLAQELGLQPRQVAVWFQNRRARWKTKQLERDYGVLKANYDSLKQDLESLQNDNDALIKEIRKLKARLKEDNTESNLSAAEIEALASESDNPAPEPTSAVAGAGAATKPAASLTGSDPFNAQAVDFKDGPSDSDSSAILNEGNSPNAAVLSQNRLISSPPSSITYLSLMPEPAARDVLGGGVGHQPQFVKMEEHNFFSEEGCNFFSEDQAPTLHWYSPESW